MLAGHITNSPAWWQFLSDGKDSFGSIESILKSLAILAAGIWAFWRFVLNREKFPRANLKHQIEFWEHSESEWHVRVSLHIENSSKVLLRISDGYTWVQQIKPTPVDAVEAFKEESRDPEKASYEARWDLIGEKSHRKEQEIEPGESDDVFMDFFVNRFYQKVLIYSFIENSSKPGRHIGWRTSTILDFAKPAGALVNEGQGQGAEKPRPRDSRPIKTSATTRN